MLLLSASCCLTVRCVAAAVDAFSTVRVEPNLVS